jgi:hypothetical protein
MVAVIGAGDVFSKSRDFPLGWGLSQGRYRPDDRTILGKISKRL